MKKSILLFAALFSLGWAGLAQNYNLVIFSEDGEPFFAFVNGIRQNNKPETNIRITDLNSEGLNVRIEFEDKALPKLKQNMMPEPGYEHTVNIKKNMKNEMKMRYFGKVALADAPKGNAPTVAYHTAEDPVDESSYGSTSINGHTTVHTTTTSTNAYSTPENVSVNINLGGTGVNMSVKGMDDGRGVHSTSSTTVTTSSSSSSTGGYTNKQQTETSAQPVKGSYAGCTSAMSPASYEKMKQSVEAKPFSETKMSTAKIATKNNCLSVNQVKGICALFSMDEDKLAYAKFAYDNCVDKGNYYQVSEAFSFSSTTEDLNKFLEAN